MPPMHQVKRRRTVCFCTFEGCRGSHPVPETIRIRLRGVSSYPCLKIDCQACESVIWRLVSFQSNLAIRYPSSMERTKKALTPISAKSVEKFQLLRQCAHDH